MAAAVSNPCGARRRACLAIAASMLAWQRGFAQPSVGSSGKAANGGMYRSDLPPVLAPESTIDHAATTQAQRAAFRAAYQRAGRPRVVIFWNRELEDELVDIRSERVDIQAAGVQTGPAGVGVIAATRQQRLDNPAQRGGLSSTLAPLEAAFVQVLAETGVRLVDRATALRLQHAQRRQAGKPVDDSRANEIDAISGRADVLLEVMVVRAGAQPDAVELKLLAKDTRSGELLFALSSDGRPKASQAMAWRPGATGFEAVPANSTSTRFVAGAAGFEREAPPRRTLHEVGEQLAVELMAAWQRALVGR